MQEPDGINDHFDTPNMDTLLNADFAQRNLASVKI